MESNDQIKRYARRDKQISKDLDAAAARIIYPHYPGKGVYKPEKMTKFFKKVYPLTP